MTDQEINRAVAESVSASFGCSAVIEKDYCNDLNAMHEVEKTLFRTGYTDTLNQNHWNTLWRVCGDLYCKTTTVAHATARQRAEAYLRTIGKWRDK